MEDFYLVVGLIFTLATFVFALFNWAQHQAAISARLNRLRPRNALFGDSVYSHSHIAIAQPSVKTVRWHEVYLFISNKQIVAYPKKMGNDTPLFECMPHHIEGFWRPTKYEEGDNTIEIHANIEGKWTILKARMSKARMFALVRTLKELVSADMTRAYRQRRPYIYRDPASAQLAKQNLQGAWELDAPFRAYLMPSALVFLRAGDEVERMIPLRDIQNIVALRRLDAERGGLVRFTLASTGETLAIALEDYEAWGKAIATAARRTLEEPLLQKQKKRQDNEDEDVYDELVGDSSVLELPEETGFLILDDWHDGEIIAWQPKSRSNA